VKKQRWTNARKKQEVSAASEVPVLSEVPITHHWKFRRLSMVLIFSAMLTQLKILSTPKVPIASTSSIELSIGASHREHVFQVRQLPSVPEVSMISCQKAQRLHQGNRLTGSSDATPSEVPIPHLSWRSSLVESEIKVTVVTWHSLFVASEEESWERLDY
jgi:hypothetical protein